jgi:hypothetical protein
MSKFATCVLVGTPTNQPKGHFKQGMKGLQYVRDKTRMTRKEMLNKMKENAKKRSNQYEGMIDG